MSIRQRRCVTFCFPLIVVSFLIFFLSNKKIRSRVAGSFVSSRDSFERSSTQVEGPFFSNLTH